MKTFNKKALVLSAMLSLAVAPAAQANFITDLWGKIKAGYESVNADYKAEDGGLLKAAKNPWAYGTAAATILVGVAAYLAYTKYFAKDGGDQPQS